MRDLFRIEIDETRLRTSNYQPATRNCEPARPQPIAIESSANDTPIGERNRRRAIPRLGAVRVIAQELRALMPLGRRRQKHPHRLRDRPPIARDFQFHRLVEAGRIGAAIGQEQAWHSQEAV